MKYQRNFTDRAKNSVSNKTSFYIVSENKINKEKNCDKVCNKIFNMVLLSLLHYAIMPDLTPLLFIIISILLLVQFANPFLQLNVFCLKIC